MFDNLSYESWCKDLSYRLLITSKVRDQLKSGNVCILSSPCTTNQEDDILEKKMECMRQSKLMLQSLFNDILLNTNCISMPDITFWGPSPENR